MPQRITVVGPNLPQRAQEFGTFHVHAEGCTDLTRGMLRGVAIEPYDTFEVESLTEMCDIIYPPEDFNCRSGEYLSDFYVAPCVQLDI